MVFAFLASISEFIYIVGTKKFLELRKHANYGSFLIVLFAFLFLGSLCLWPRMGFVDLGQFFSFKYILLFLGMIVVSISVNLLYYRGLHEDKLVEFDLVTMTYPVITIFLASVLLPDEFSINIFIAGIVASVALLFSHMKRRHIRFNKMEKKLLLLVFFSAIETLLFRFLLDIMSSVSLYVIRTGMIFLVYLVLYRKNIKHIKFDKLMFYQFLLAVMAVIFMVLEFEAYLAIGVSFTILIMLITPVLTFLWAHYEEHESFPVNKIIGAIVIIGAIIYAYLTG